MLQRIQSVFLLIAFLAAVTLFVVPFWETRDSMHEIYFTSWRIQGVGPEGALYMTSVADDYFLLIPALLNVLIAIFPLYIIFQYGNRKLQVMLCSWLLLFQVLCSLACGWLVLKTESTLMEMGAETLESAYGMGLILPLVAVVFTWLARRYILRDEALIKSMDRIR